ncbi:MAG: hypothetical protein OEO23_02370 [Gemmatimonadota bacterium]|nr:hypothetical protein [Gemmatimonadota bacterium]
MRATKQANRVGALALAAVLAVTGSACVTTTGGGGGGAGQMDLGPTLSVERFLNAANTRDLDAMMRLFGTAEGPIGDTGSTFGCAFKRMGSWVGLGDRCQSRQAVELRMDAIARIIRHQDYRIGGEEHVAGRKNPTTQVTVDLDLGPRRVEGVPFVVVQAGRGNWLIQEIALQRLTS